MKSNESEEEIDAKLTRTICLLKAENEAFLIDFDLGRLDRADNCSKFESSSKVIKTFPRASISRPGLIYDIQMFFPITIYSLLIYFNSVDFLLGIFFIHIGLHMIE